MLDPFGDFATAGYLRNVYGYKEKAAVTGAERFAFKAISARQPSSYAE